MPESSGLYNMVIEKIELRNVPCSMDKVHYCDFNQENQQVICMYVCMYGHHI